MPRANDTISVRVLRVWVTVVTWVRRRLRRQRALPPARGKSWAEIVSELPEDLQLELDDLAPPPGVVGDTIDRAVRDFADLCEIVDGPGGGAGADDIVDDIVVLADAEALLRALIGRAAAVQALVSVATRRKSDRKTREAAGEAVLRLRDDARVLASAVTAAIRWTAERSAQTRDELRASAEALRAADARST